jgi:hypothetical protein
MRFGKSSALLNGLMVYGLAVGQTYAAGKFWSVLRLVRFLNSGSNFSFSPLANAEMMGCLPLNR